MTSKLLSEEELLHTMRVIDAALLSAEKTIRNSMSASLALIKTARPASSPLRNCAYRARRSFDQPDFILSCSCFGLSE